MTGSGRVSVLRALLWMVVPVSLAGIVAGGYLVVLDLSARGETFDGLVALIGAMVLAGSVLAGVLAAIAALLAVRKPLLARVVGVLLALTAAALVYPLAVDTTWGVWLFPFPLALVVVAVLPDAPAR